MPRQEGAVDLTSDPTDLAALLLATRTAYQASLVETAKARKQLEENIKAARIQAAERSRLFLPDESLLTRLSEAWTEFGEGGVEPRLPAPPSDLDQAEKLWRDVVKRCNGALALFKVGHISWMSSKHTFFGKKRPEPRLPKSFQMDIGILRQVLDAHHVLRGDLERRIQDEAEPKITAEFDAAAASREDRLTELLRSNLASIQMGVDLLGTSGEPWARRLAEPCSLSTRPNAATRLGTITSGLPYPYDVQVPCVLDFPSARGLAIQTAMQLRSQSLALLRSIVLRVLMDFPAGQIHCSFIDPTAVGQTFAEFMHLGDYDATLIDTGVKTSAPAIERSLAEHAAHLETVVSKYLRGQFENIHDYNRHAGEVAEPLRLIVIADYPRQFSDRAAEQLLSIVENGPRSGIYTLLLYAPEDEEPRSVPFARMTQTMDHVVFQREGARIRMAGDDRVVDFSPDACPPISFSADGRATTPAAEFIEALGQAAKERTVAVVTMENFLPALNRNRSGPVPDMVPGAPPLTLLPETWWTATTVDMAVGPLGRSGARGVASMFFSSTAVAGGGIMVGLPRSGKTTSLHAMILTMAMLYSPEELELYLIDAKHGVEFKIYESLPQARMVSVHSEREFSVAVLKNLQAKIRERAELIKNQGSGLSNLTEYRRATGVALPRIVAIVDEFHEVFEEADAIGLEAFAAFSDIVRMGPFSGVHVVVSSQTLSSMPAMDRPTLTLLPQRVAFMCNEYDAEIVMGDTNKAPRMLSKTGEGLFNPSRGDESKNQLFQGLYVGPDQRSLLLRQLRAKADAVGWHRRPRVFDGDAMVVRPRLEDVQTPSRRFTVPVGEPLTLAETECIVVPRTRGANVLLIGDREDEQPPDFSVRGVLHSFLVAARIQNAAVTVVDCIGDEEVGHGLTIMDVARDMGARYVRLAHVGQVLLDLAATVSGRVAEGSYKAPTQLLAIFGLQRALSLMPYDPDDMDDSGRPSLGQLLATIVTTGPEVGVHVVVDTDRVRSAELRLGPDLLGEFTLRVAGSLADHKDLALVSGSYGDIAPVRPGQLLIGDLLKDSAKRARGYTLITRG